MQLLLELLAPGPEGLVPFDIALDCDADDTIATITSALATHVARYGLDPGEDAGVSLLVTESRAVLDRRTTVGQSELRSGQTVQLTRQGESGASAAGRVSAASEHALAAPTDDHREMVSLDIASGTETGTSIPLTPGVYRVGREAQECQVVIDDPLMSRHHLTIEVAPDLSVTVTPDPDALHGTSLAGVAFRDTRPLQPSEVIRAGATTLAVRPLQKSELRDRDLLGQVPFNRSPYYRTTITERTLDPLPAPPDAPRSKDLTQTLLMLLPALGIAAVAVVTGRPEFLLMALMYPLAMIGRKWFETRTGHKSFETERADFLERLETRVADVETALEQERAERLRAAPDVAELGRQARSQQIRLWERTRESPDFLTVRLGLGDLESQVTAELERGGAGELRDEALQALSAQSIVRMVPVTANLDHLAAFGLYGDAGTAGAVARAIAIQVACLHSPEDVVLAAAVAPGALGDWEWLKWLPHARSSTSPLEGEHLVAGAEDTNQLLSHLQEVAATRAERGAGDGVQVLWPKVLLIVHEDAEPDPVLLSRLLDSGPAAGLVTIWLGHGEPQVPRQCRGTLACSDPRYGAASLIRFTDPEAADHQLQVETLQPSKALEIGHSVAALRDASTAMMTTAIPRKVLLLETLGLPRPTAAELIQRWRVPRSYGLSAALGQEGAGTFGLDLVADGPHALIAGTSGAGKSELLQTLVASLATEYSPERLNFLFIDYKGGSGTAAFSQLPHTVGSVTNLNERLSLRALVSLRAELNHRMEILARVGARLEQPVKDLEELLGLAPEEAPPNLVLVVDEFATLVKEIPDFVQGMVDIAQRGRSLGIHLVLATQRPAGAVNDNILANTNLRIALRVLDAADSTSVINSREAAEIPPPLRGRAYARKGPQQLVAFQCAWSGADYAPEQSDRTIKVRPFRFGRNAELEADAPAPSRLTGMDNRQPAEAPPTQLQVVVEAAANAAEQLELAPARRPWRPALLDSVALTAVLAQMRERSDMPDLSTDPGRRVVVGRADDPEKQDQPPALIDLEASGGLLIYGAGGTGKTTALRTISAGLVAQGPPEAVQLYALDFANRALGQLSSLPHCAGVAMDEDLERVTRTIAFLLDESERRRRLLAEANAESLSSLRQSRGEAVLARLVILMDGYSAFREYFEKDLPQWLDSFHRLVAEGRQVGIHTVIAVDRATSVRGALFSAISARLVLRMDATEMTTLGVPTKVAREAELEPGRAFLGAKEVQIAAVSSDLSGPSQAQAMAGLGARLAARYRRADPVPELPEFVTFDGSGAPDSLQVPIGCADLTLDPVAIDLSRYHLIVTGPPESGKSSVLASLAEALSRNDALAMTGLGVSRSPLAGLTCWKWPVFGRGGHADLVKDDLLAYAEQLDERRTGLLVVIDDFDDLEEAANAQLVKLLTFDAVRMLVSIDSGRLQKTRWTGFMGALATNRQLLILQPESSDEVRALTELRYRFRPGQRFPPGRGVLVTGRQTVLIQAAGAH